MNFEEWKRCRTLTYVNTCIASFTFGLSLTIYYPKKFYYFRDTMGVKNAAVFYGLGWAFLCGAGVFSSFAASYYADKTKKVREIFLWTTTINMVGNMFYLLYYSPYLVLFGKFLIGPASARSVASVGELSRIYEKDLITQKLSTAVLFSVIGRTLAPCSTFLFSLVDTHIAGWDLNINNVVGLVMGVMYFLLFWIHHFTLRNLSKEYNMKREALNFSPLQESRTTADTENEILEGEEEESGNDEEEGCTKQLSFIYQYLLALKTVLKNKETLFLYALTFCLTYARGMVAILLPIKSSLYLGWMQKDLAVWNIIMAVGGAIPTSYLISHISKFVNDVYILVHSFIALLLLLLFMGVVPFIHDNLPMTNVLFYAMSIIYGTSSAAFHIASRSMIAKLLPENIQTVGEAIRNSLFEVSYLAVGLSVKLLDSYTSEFMLVGAFLTTFALAWLLINADDFKEPTAIQVDNQSSSR